MALFKIKLDLDQKYIDLINQYLAVLSAFLFLILLEPLENLNALTLLFYAILGIMFNKLILEEVVEFY